MLEEIKQAIAFNRALPDRIRRYLRDDRGISDEVIDGYLLGWNGSRITIPVFNRENDIAFFRLAKDPEDRSDSPKMLAPSGSRAELYGWESVLTKPERIIISEGEFDRLVLESRGLAAVTSTGGATTFRPEWASYFDPIPYVYICFDNDDAGRRGAERIARIVRHARLVRLPDEVGYGGDVTDFFVRLRRSPDEFMRLLNAAESLPQEASPRPEAAQERRSGNSKIEELKSRISIADVAGRYLALRKSGGHYLARCPFHEERNPSFVLYPENGTFHCFGCRAHGDVIDFLMRMERLTFREAAETLRNLET